MKLSQLLDGVSVTKLFQTLYGRMVVTHEVEVPRIQYDSRKVTMGDCFVAIRGATSDGHAFITEAVHNGAKVVVLERDSSMSDSFFMHNGVVKVVVPDSRKALARIAGNFYGHPSKKLSMVGVTGTNGKTTTTHIIKSILDAAGKTAGLIGTIEYKTGSESMPASHTTPDSLELNQLLATMVERGCAAVSMEVSSHALHQSRIEGLNFDVAVFTNLSQDHLDYHGTMGEYFAAKKLLFDGLNKDAHAVTNSDDTWGLKIVATTAAKTVTYGVLSQGDVTATDIELGIGGTEFQVEHGGERTSVSSPLVGKFNVYNTLAAFSAGISLGIPKEAIRQGIANLKNVKGRFERVPSTKGWTAIIDYAHTPDALEKCLRAIHDILPTQSRGKIITVFGAGGDRDRTKRPTMGRIVSELSDVAIVTSDNPRTEDPEKIIDDILTGVNKTRPVQRQADRGKAIEQAIRMAGSGDVILVAGKGHEEYQVIGKEKIHFSDREIVEQFI